MAPTMSACRLLRYDCSRASDRSAPGRVQTFDGSRSMSASAQPDLAGFLSALLFALPYGRTAKAQDERCFASLTAVMLPCERRATSDETRTSGICV
jgi:hypothetical protein